MAHMSLGELTKMGTHGYPNMRMGSKRSPYGGHRCSPSKYVIPCSPGFGMATKGTSRGADRCPHGVRGSCRWACPGKPDAARAQFGALRLPEL